MFMLISCFKLIYLVSLLLPDEENEQLKEKPEEATPQTPPPFQPITEEENKIIEDKWYPQIAYASDKALLLEVEELEEKVFSASLQVKV